MSKTIIINGDTHILTSDIKYVRPVGAEEQAKIGERYGIDGTQFKAAIELKNSDKPMLTRETCEELSVAGLALVDLGNTKMVPAETIISARTLDDAGRKKLGDKGFKVSNEFQATVETQGGLMLAKLKPEQVMARKAQALEIMASGGDKPAGSDVAGGAPNPNEKVG